MTDVPYKPEEKALKRIEEQQRAEMKRESERKVAKTKPASGGVAFKPEPVSENEKLKLAVSDQRFARNVEAEYVLKQRYGPSESTADVYSKEALRPKAARFFQEFGDLPNAKKVADAALSNSWPQRVGADHHIDVANILGKNEIRTFEEKITPKSENEANWVDIATNDSIAVECKNVTIDRPYRNYIGEWFRQADKRLEPNAEGKTYRGVVVVVPDGKLAGETGDIVRRYEANHPGVRVCELSQLKQTLAEIRSVKAGG